MSPYPPEYAGTPGGETHQHSVLPLGNIDTRGAFAASLTLDPIQRKRKLSRLFVPVEIRRSASTPHFRELVSADTGTISSPADKRRNKLGYQRTSIACGHCRRRKIRCLPPTTEDPQGRCANCIRLKKECTYYPVDHATDGRSNKRDTGTLASSSTSSPRTPLAPELHQQSVASQPGPSQVGQPVNLPSSGAEPASANTTERAFSVPYLHSQPVGEPFQQTFPFGHGAESEEWAPPNFGSHHPAGSPYWTSAESTPIRPSFPQSGLHPIASGSNSQYNSPLPGYQENSAPWPPVRSASFSHFEGAQPNYAYPGIPASGVNTPPLQYPMQHVPTQGTSHVQMEGNMPQNQYLQSSELPVQERIAFQDPGWIQAEGQPHQSAPNAGWFNQPQHMLESNPADSESPYTPMPPHFYPSAPHSGP